MTRLLPFALLALLAIGCDNDINVPADGCSSPCGDVDAGPPEPVDYTSCEVSSECTLASTTCCGTCERGTLRDFTAVNVSMSGAHYEQVACPEVLTDPPVCPACAALPNPNLVATCDMGACVARDIEAVTTLTECTVDADCMLRRNECCECGEGGMDNTIAIAVTANAELTTMLCDPDAICEDCAPSFEPILRAVCDAGACRVRFD